MLIELYSSGSDRKKIKKNIAKIYEFDFVLKNGSSIVNPIVTIFSESDLTACNYAMIPEYGRYYFINDVVCLKENVYELSLHVDVLMSYNVSGVKIVKESGQISLTPDSSIPLLPNRKLQYYAGSVVNDGSLEYILVVAGGGA